MRTRFEAAGIPGQSLVNTIAVQISWLFTHAKRSEPVPVCLIILIRVVSVPTYVKAGQENERGGWGADGCREGCTEKPEGCQELCSQCPAKGVGVVCSTDYRPP